MCLKQNIFHSIYKKAASWIPLDHLISFVQLGVPPFEDKKLGHAKVEIWKREERPEVD